MSEIKGLIKDTAIYGVSSMVGKFLNWCLVPLYTFVLQSSADYGIVTNLYAWVALLLVILTYGMETGFFRYVNQEGENPTKVYGTVLTTVGLTSAAFIALIVGGRHVVANLLGYGDHAEYIGMMGTIVAVDAWGCIPFAYLRYQKKAVRFATLKLVMIGVNIGMNLFFLVVCPWIVNHGGEWILKIYDPGYGVGYVFVSNMISTGVVTLLLLPQIREAKGSGGIDKTLLKKILKYSLPLLVLGVAGIMNQTVDKIIFPYLLDDPARAQAQLGIYGACFKVAMVMMVFTQAFRYAYEPFVFGVAGGEGDKKKEYAVAMRFYVIFSLVIFLGMVMYKDALKLLLRSDYHEGLRVVPMVLTAYILQGIYFNLSIWYKLTDRTMWGAWFSLLGLGITIGINVAGVPLCDRLWGAGYFASAGASVVCFGVLTIVSWAVGQKYYPVKYDIARLGGYALLAGGLYAASEMVTPDMTGGTAGYYAYRTLLLGVFMGVLLMTDLKPLVGMMKKRFLR